ncbi:MAG TPA: OmpA family protein [Polyangiaceae bacterium]|nr:OmpA family protein [Polyangiaceae bacterium]
MENILELTKFAFQGDTVQRLSSVLHESQSATRSGIEAAIPASLAGLAAHAASEQKAADLLGTFRGGDFPHADANEVTKMVDDPVATARLAESGQGFLSRLFGGRLSGIVEALSGQAGVSRASASTLLGLSAPLVLAVVSKEAESRNLDARGLSRFLAEQGRRASGALPASISTMLGAIPGFSALGQAGEGAAAPAPNAGEGVVERAEQAMGRARDRAGSAVGDASRRVQDYYERSSHRAGAAHAEDRRRLGWLLPALVLVALAAFLLLRLRAVHEMARASRPQIVVLSPATGATALETYVAGSEPTPRRFSLSGVDFATASSAIASSPILDGVARTLKAHPSATVRIEGHTDRTGTPAANQALSKTRAEAVKSYLVAQGVDANRIEAVGRGAEEPIVDTDEANQENRRVDIVVVHR